MYEDVLSYEKVIARLQETVKSLTKTDDPSADVKDIITAYQQLCQLAEVILEDILASYSNRLLVNVGEI